MLSTWAVARSTTQLTHSPACRTPTLKVQSSEVIASISIKRCAISRKAERPSFKAAPAWLRTPLVSMAKRAMA